MNIGICVDVGCCRKLFIYCTSVLQKRQASELMMVGKEVEGQW
jgi:hypothetical protein